MNSLQTFTNSKRDRLLLS